MVRHFLTRRALTSCAGSASAMRSYAGSTPVRLGGEFIAPKAAMSWRGTHFGSSRCCGLIYTLPRDQNTRIGPCGTGPRPQGRAGRGVSNRSHDRSPTGPAIPDRSAVHPDAVRAGTSSRQRWSVAHPCRRHLRDIDCAAYGYAAMDPARWSRRFLSSTVCATTAASPGPPVRRSSGRHDQRCRHNRWCRCH
jgi:hypothetical protein